MVARNLAKALKAKGYRVLLCAFHKADAITLGGRTVNSDLLYVIQWDSRASPSPICYCSYFSFNHMYTCVHICFISLYISLCGVRTYGHFRSFPCLIISESMQRKRYISPQ